MKFTAVGDILCQRRMAEDYDGFREVKAFIEQGDARFFNLETAVHWEGECYGNQFSGGTYIRTLCADIGAKLGCGGAMATLERTEACGFPIEKAYNIEELKEFGKDKLLSLLLPVEEIFSDRPIVKLSEFFEKLSRGGCEIYQSKIGTHFPVGTRVRIYGKNGFFALGEIIPESECKAQDLGSAVKAIKTFELQTFSPPLSIIKSAQKGGMAP